MLLENCIISVMRNHASMNLWYDCYHGRWLSYCYIITDIVVKVIAEDDSVMSSSKSSCLRMKIGYPDNRPSYSIQPPDSRLKTDEHGVYVFR